MLDLLKLHEARHDDRELRHLGNNFKHRGKEDVVDMSPCLFMVSDIIAGVDLSQCLAHVDMPISSP